MTKKQLLEELEKYRQRLSELETHDVEQKNSDDMRRKYEFIVNTSRHFMTLVSRNFVFEAANTSYCKAIGKPVIRSLGIRFLRCDTQTL